MRLYTYKSKSNTILYMIKSFRNDKGKNTSKIIEKLGTLEEVKEKANGEDPITWAKNYIAQKTKEEQENHAIYYQKFIEGKPLDASQKLYNIGYLFLQKIYNSLNLSSICNKISKKYKFEFDLNKILQDLIYTRILYPSSKLSSFESAMNFIEKPNYQLHDIYRALEFISKESDFIQAELYKNSLDVINRNNKVLYYDCTNYFFEVEQEDGLKQYGVSKEHRPNPIVQMGLLMDGNGIPLAFVLNPGNTNEQTTLKPLEKQILKDFNLAEFIICTDAGLSSIDNRKFNSIENRSFIVTHSIKKSKEHIKQWALSPDGWHTLANPKKEINLNNIKNNPSNDTIYYKERWINENNLEQRLIISYSPKYAEYQKNIRNKQIERAQKFINNPYKINSFKQTDFKRFINITKVTSDGEIANKPIFSLNSTTIENESKFDGFYAVCTTLEDNISEIIKVNKNRWEIEESFRILKTEFKSRPVYLQRDDRITAHFTTCFIALTIFRILEKKIDSKFSYEKIIETLKDMRTHKIEGLGYQQLYSSSEITSNLNKIFKISLDQEFISNKNMKKILNEK